MKNYIYLCAFMLSLSTIAQTTTTKELGDFTTLKVFNGIAVELIKSTEQKMEITGDKSDLVKLKQVNNVLKLSLPFSLKPANNVANGEVIIKIFYNKEIKILDANEGATITGKDFNQDKVEVKAQENGYINLTTKSKYLRVKAISGGIVKLTGTTKNQEVDVDLYGIYHGFNLKADGSSTIKAGSGAKAEILAGDVLSAKVSFGGSIFYKGNPDVVKDKKVIGGIIQKRD